jgi:MoaA/NifB/PqqE/SkfB family radical SAM enzyme
MPVERYEAMYEAGLDHLHVSVHGIGQVLDSIVGVDGAGEKQAKTLRWLNDTGRPWRMNMTVQQLNYKTLPDIAEFCMAHGCRHIVSLGFLPHYEWNDPVKLRTVAVDPLVLEPYINAVCDTVAERPDVLLTVRYHPMCRIEPQYRKYVVNARYVLYDPWEWDYGHAGDSADDLKRAAENLGNSVANMGLPCSKCTAFMACGGWNRIYYAAFSGSVTPVTDMPPEHRVWGALHEKNPANAAKGYFGR